MGKVLFVSQLPLDRCENMAALYEAYDGPKEFRCGQESMRTAEADGFAAVVCDALPCYIDGKDRIVSINIGHGLTGGKLYGLDEQRHVDREAFAQTDWAIASSVAGIPIVAKQLGISEDRVLPLGFPRTDRYVGKRKGDGGTVLAGYRRAYLYAPTFRDETMGGWLPRINWKRLDSMMADDEMLAVKRHYFTHEPLVYAECSHIVEADLSEPSADYLYDCDVLITDYSSMVFDAYLLGKPSVLTTDDMGEYLRDRGMYRGYPDGYGMRWLRAESHEDAMLAMMREAAQNGMGATERRCRDLAAGACDGHSCERICGLIRREAGR